MKTQDKSSTSSNIFGERKDRIATLILAVWHVNHATTTDVIAFEPPRNYTPHKKTNLTNKEISSIISISKSKHIVDDIEPLT